MKKQYIYSINEQIAIVLGFVPHHDHLICGKPQWEYPEGWKEYDIERPQLKVPNFEKMHDIMLKMYNVVKYGF